MLRKRVIGLVLVLLLPGTVAAGAQASAAVFSAEQLDNLLAPVALYPDPLIAQLLPASTFVDQVDEASRWLRAGNSADKIDSENWDVSIKAVAHYSQVLYTMADDLDWTTAVGQAYVSQSADVMSSIQRLRKLAYDAGTLVTTSQQQVVVAGSAISVVPAQPQVIYVPQYDPQVVYVDDNDADGAIAAGVIAFGTGLAIGAWLNNDCNWNDGNVYYHGWNGSGWVNSSRAHVNVNNNYYVNRNYTNVNVNREVVNRNVNYNNISKYNNVSRNANYDNVNRDRAGQTNAAADGRNKTANNKVLDNNINANDAKVDAARGRTEKPATRADAQPANRPAAQPAARPAGQPSRQPAAKQATSSGMGEAKSRNETKADSSRGQASRAEASRQPAPKQKPQSSGGSRSKGGGGGGGGGGRGGRP